MSDFAIAAAALSSHERPPRMSFHARARMRERYGITLTDAEAAEIVARASGPSRWRGRDLTIGIAPDTGGRRDGHQLVAVMTMQEET